MLEDDADTTKTGLIKINGHCLFVWHEILGTGERRFERADHCNACLDELARRIGYAPLFIEDDAAG